jgi:hypothetical protein
VSEVRYLDIHEQTYVYRLRHSFFSENTGHFSVALEVKKKMFEKIEEIRLILSAGDVFHTKPLNIKR